MPTLPGILFAASFLPKTLSSQEGAALLILCARMPLEIRLDNPLYVPTGETEALRVEVKLSPLSCSTAG